MINQELVQEGKMESFKQFLGKVNLLFLLFLLFTSCKKNRIDMDVLLVTNNISNKIYNKEVEQLKTFFSNKFLEQPEVYKITQEKITSVQSEILLFNKLSDIDEKKEFIKSFIIKLKKIFLLDDVTFVCLKIDNNDEIVFNSVVENDFNRILYLIYKASYEYHYTQ